MRWLPLIYLLLFSACARKPAPQDIVLQLRELNELATVEYTVSKIVKASDDQTWYKVGDRKILMSCRATVKDGIDLNRLSPSAIRVDGKKVSIDLPAAQILSVIVRPEEIRTEYEEVGLFRSDFTAAERNSLMAQGEAQIRRQVAETGILRDAESQAGIALGNLFRSMGFSEVSIRFPSRSPSNPESRP
jgi:hypothetical protein